MCRIYQMASQNNKPQPLAYDFSNGSVIREGGDDASDTKEVVSRIVNNTITPEFSRLIIASIGTVAGLTWTDYFRSLFDKGGVFFRFKHYGPLFVAIVATLFALLITNTLRNQARRAEANDPTTTSKQSS